MPAGQVIVGPLALAVVLVAGLAAPGEAGSIPSRTGSWVVASDGARTSVAGFLVQRGGALPDVTLRRAIRAWGPPSRLGRPGGGRRASCTARWTRPAVVVDLANFGLAPPGQSACTPRLGKTQQVRTTGARWRTDRGLRVGDGQARIRDLYPRAVRRSFPTLGRLWLLFPRETVCIGVCDTPTVLVSPVLVDTRAGRVAGFRLLVGGAGE